MTPRLMTAALLLTASALPASAETVRFATYNASLNRASEGELRRDMESGSHAQIAAVSEVIQRIAPDILLINEFDYDPGVETLFAQNYLARPQNVSGMGPTAGISYDYSFVAPSNTGIATGFDLDKDGSIGGGNDAFGFGLFPGQYGMAVSSRHEILTDRIRTFQTFRWADMPGARLPVNPDGSPFYTAEEQDILRLSSKSHWDVPIRIGDSVVHFLVSHPTPPSFDGPEDRNGLRNADEIRFWADYISGADYIYDDAGVRGGLASGALFVIAGDQNADPHDGDSVDSAINQLLFHPLIDAAMPPRSEGGAEAAALQGGANLTHSGDPAEDTADFADTAPGNLRVDYVLPSHGLAVQEAGVFWPPRADPLSVLTGEYPFPTSDHRPVWIDVAMPAPIPLPAGAMLLVSGLGGLALLRRRRHHRG
ncbi:MAG: endonuclease/exonuclease/phosphatase family protein [Paracoccus sp. (in: a-proteobacteria)]|uniref:endonuclease/exonuclease/phosphatase family protein n=1 Tax=Paracoccus sp. TaxID=267 RepID=UPI0026DF0D7D|nr:endonuclease/exonuclease/phosphatase family protein [Paracoccus sp. (in: a-proteobacteria)]MDO5612026.1 endonuclease/exonuclease/phosphatase family protein [Paracoccus sp. (in: a-proteobacteria)]